ncbi:DUF4142 domain-containing protein [Streptomyces sp. NPDC052721]|uniref:DUF4142 domain-containing protein n=1 Tax=Streptomyces sp. NPDC052721 TaxID=3154955 RepID=UPI00341F60ED
MRKRSVAAAVAAVALCGTAAPHAFAQQLAGQDRKFLVQVHQGNLAEIAAGQDAGRHARSECVKQVGAVLVRDHTKLDADVKTLAGKLNVRLPASPSAQKKRQLAAVQAKAGTPAYDTAWLRVQEAGHRQTLALIDQEIKTGKNSQVVAAARNARPVVAMHLNMVRQGTCHMPAHTGMTGANRQ